MSGNGILPRRLKIKDGIILLHLYESRLLLSANLTKKISVGGEFFVWEMSRKRRLT